jgi:hypothetical protein
MSYINVMLKRPNFPSTSQKVHESEYVYVPPHKRVEKDDMFHAKRKAATRTAFLWE